MNRDGGLARGGGHFDNDALTSPGFEAFRAAGLAWRLTGLHLILPGDDAFLPG